MNPPEQPAANDASWLREPLTDSGEIAQRYDAWVATYDTELVDAWRYDAPAVASRLLVDSGAVGPVLDVGCGTGLVGRGLAAVGFTDIDGVDLSPVSLDAARCTAVYRSLTLHDFNQDVLPFDDGSYGAVTCVGVLSYAHHPADVVRDFIRIVRSGGVIMFTHRTDLWDACNFGDALEAMRTAGALSAVSWTEPQEYMPGSPDVADLRIRYVTATVG